MTSIRPLITVVTIAWNDLPALKRTCASIGSQTSKDAVSHLVVDGASTDGSAEWYAVNAPVPEHRFISEPDNGIYDAMNKGIREADGEYVVFLNAGDELADEQVFERQVARLREHPCDWGYGAARVVDAGGQDVRPPVGMVPYSRRKHLFGRATICHQAVVMRTEFIRGLGGFDENYGLAADYHLLLRAGRLSVPDAWGTTDVLYEAGGVSETDVYRQLWRRHDARVDAESWSGPAAAADAAFTRVQGLNVRSRKFVKSRLMPRAPRPTPDGRAWVGDVPIVRTTLDEAVGSILTGDLAAPRHLHFTNAYSVASASASSALAEVFQSGYCYPDGMPLTWALTRLDPGQGWGAGRRVRGPDVFPTVLDKGRAVGAKHYLLGGTEAALAQLVEQIGTRFPGAEVVGAVSPPFLPVEEVDWQAHLADIEKSGADLVWVGLGTPKQDFVARLLADQDPDRTYLAVGAAFDFVAGTLKTAPHWMQAHGLEWVFRFASEPRRLWRRYVFGNTRFMAIVAGQWVRQRVSTRR